MTKREAYDRLDKGDVTWGHLKHWIAMVESEGYTTGISAINKALTKRQSLDILTAGIAPKEDNDLVVSKQYTSQRNAVNSMIAVNVLRETHFKVSA